MWDTIKVSSLTLLVDTDDGDRERNVKAILHKFEAIPKNKTSF